MSQIHSVFLYHPFLILGLEFQYHSGHCNSITLSHHIPVQGYAHFNYPLLHSFSLFFLPATSVIQGFVSPWILVSLLFIQSFTTLSPFDPPVKYHHLIFPKQKFTPITSYWNPSIATQCWKMYFPKVIWKFPMISKVATWLMSTYFYTYYYNISC